MRRRKGEYVLERERENVRDNRVNRENRLNVYSERLKNRRERNRQWKE